MDWNQLTHLPAFWVPFKSLPFAVLAVVAVPALLAFIVGIAMFKRRVGGVYFADHHPGAGADPFAGHRRTTRDTPAAAMASPI